MPSHDNALAAAASAAASLMLVRSVVNELLPDEVREMLRAGVGCLWSRISSQHTITIEKKVDGLTSNHVYEVVKAYLAAHHGTRTQQHLCVSSSHEDDKMTVTMAEGEEMADVYEGTMFKWCLNYRNVPSPMDSGKGRQRQVEAHSFVVTFPKKHKEKALDSYLPYIVATAKAMKAQEQERTLQIYMNNWEDWSPMYLHHPSTFDTLAMDHKQKQAIVDDLNRFIKRKDYYKRIGKAWKRGYLLYGPPGTGKSSLIAAMANHLKFDIYDLELTSVQSNMDLKMLLVGIGSRSILVVEDIDCTIKLQQRREGGEEASGEERIIVFTTNYKERLDPALLRPGRMDMHIYMGYCTFESFRILTNNYHLIDYHATYPEIEKLMKEVMVTTAEVAEVLMRKDDAEVALHDLIDLLPHVVATAKAMKDQHRNLKMHMIEYDAWTAVDLRHPSTFDTLAMDKKLLYGPPGTGKSSLIAAMANYLKFDIYDLELTEVKSNSDLRRLLVGMSNRSILVVEDIDCSIDLHQREEGERRARSSSTGEENDDKVTLSGLLNFVDGLWSTSGEERIIVFTTNYRERLDPALLRPGRMDMHIHMGYCTAESFRILARNYHSVENHAMYPEIEQLIEEVMVSPAEVAEVLMRNENSDVVLQDLLEFLKAKRKLVGESKAANENGNE